MEYEDILELLDDYDERFIIVDYEQEETEVAFRWENQHESITEVDTYFRKIHADY